MSSKETKAVFSIKNLPKSSGLQPGLRLIVTLALDALEQALSEVKRLTISSQTP